MLENSDLGNDTMTSKVSDLEKELLLLKAKQSSLLQYSDVTLSLLDKKGTDEFDLNKFAARCKCLDQNKRELENVVARIQEVSLEVYPDYSPDFSSYYEYLSNHGTVMLAMDELLPPKSQAQSNQAASTKPKIKLPPLDIPSFGGDILEWNVFYESFKASVHDNPDISNEHKVQFLVSRLKDKALAVCSGIPAIASNYEIIWSNLKERYEDKRVLASKYLENILSFNPIKNNSADQLNLFIDKFISCVAALKALNVLNLGDFILCNIASRKLPAELNRRFESSLNPKQLPTIDLLTDFMKNQARILSHINIGHSHSTNKESKSNSSVPSSSKSKSNVSHSFVVKDKEKEPLCSFCNQSAHNLYRCEPFKRLPVPDRLQFIRDNLLCFNCLGKNHGVSDCKCKLSCSLCGSKHHTLLHLSKHENKKKPVQSASHTPSVPSTTQVSSNANPGTNNNNNSDVQSSISLCSTDVQNIQGRADYTVLLATVKVNISDTFGNLHSCRLLLDPCSQSSILTDSCCKKLGLKVKRTTSSVRGIGESSSPVLGHTYFNFSSRIDPAVKFSSQALVVTKVTDKLPTCKINQNCLNHLKNLPLADDTYFIEGPIDGLLGTNVYTSVIEVGKVIGDPGTPVAFNTKLGYIVMGSVQTDSHPISTIQPDSFCAFVKPSIENLFERFMDIEEVPTKVQHNTPTLSTDEMNCEKIYKSTVARDNTGRYTVDLCFKKNPDDHLGDSWNMATKRFFSLEKKLDKAPELKVEYSSIIQDYLKQNFISLVSNDMKEEGYFIPHRAVVRTDKTTTKVRIVHDASAPSSTGVSLNDCLYTGPNLYANIFTILLNFRLFQIALCADVTKMFLQIQVVPEQRKYLKFLWRSSSNEPIRVYQYNRVLFGARSSPYLSLRTLQQLAQDEKDNFPVASSRVKEDFFMDDFTSSVMTETEAETLYSEMVGLFRVGCFSLVKWQTNSNILFNKIPEDQKLEKFVKWDDKDSDSQTKVLGLRWNPKEDNLYFEVDLQESKITKRGILSTICKIWDPLGLVTPVVIYAKLIIKELWELSISWDQALPENIVSQWSRFLSELPKLNCFSVTRHLSVFKNAKLTLVGFSDSSEKAYGAVVYSRVILQDGSIKTNLICSKSKVAPKKYVSIPRLELSAALLLSKLISSVKETYESRFSVNDIFCFTDSSVALTWIRSNPSRYKTFVANRIQQIHDYVDPKIFYHVPGADNPADCITRGLFPEELCNYDCWFSGPKWLQLPQSEWKLKTFDPKPADDIDLEQKSHTLVLTSNTPSVLLVLASKFSSYRKLLRAIVYVFRFVRVLPKNNFISAADLDFAEVSLLKALQKEKFSEDIKRLARNEPCSSELIKLKPFVSDGVLRVGGRLGKSNLGYESQHPILLPKKHHIVNLIIDHYHLKNMHTGPHLLLSLLRQRYWILAARSVVRQRVRSCNFCFRYNPVPVYPLMADLPDFRVKESKVFYHTGVDYFGPINLTLSRHRGVSTTKAYVCLFICLTTKAIHLELASDLSTPIFLNALKRFLSRRSACKIIYSDRGTNFIGARNTLEELANSKITWKFNCPSAPHHGGIWEGNVRPVKNHLLKVIGSQILTYEEMTTVLAQVEALMNSRPLCPLSSDPSDPSVLTPAHFLHAEPNDFIPARDVSLTPTNHLSRYELLNNLVQNYWKRWSTEYLNNLQMREKWNIPGGKPLVPGMLVVIKRENCPPLHWPLGIIDKVFPGTDSVTRVVEIRTKSGLLKRPATKVCPLPTQ